MWEFAGNHYIVFVLSLMIVCGTITRLAYLLWAAYNRHLRSTNIREQGWPTTPNMDADGDLVAQKKD